MPHDAQESQAVASIAMISIDCPSTEAVSLSAAFYRDLLGWPVAYEGEGYAMLQGPATRLGFGAIPDHKALAWPDDGHKQFHLDLAVADIDAAAARAVELGASRPAEQPGGERWTVLLDPAGHPFCLTLAANWG